MSKDACDNKDAQKTAESLHGECLTQYIDEEPTVKNMTIDEEPTVKNMTIDKEPTEKNMTIEEESTEKNMTIDKEPTVKNMTIEEESTEKNMTMHLKTARMRSIRKKQGRKVSFARGTVQFVSKDELYEGEVRMRGNDLGRREYPTAPPASGSFRIRHKHAGKTSGRHDVRADTRGEKAVKECMTAAHFVSTLHTA